MPRSIFSLPGFQVLLFCLFAALFNWPILSIAGRFRDQTLFYYLFLAWALLILLLLLMGRNVESGDLPPKTTERED